MVKTPAHVYPRTEESAVGATRSLTARLSELRAPAYARRLAQLPSLVRYISDLPSIEVALSGDATGDVIAEFLDQRRLGIRRSNLPTSVLLLPSDHATYLKGRKRQALRTNARRAREAGMIVWEEAFDCYEPDTGAPRHLTVAAPARHWRAWLADGCFAGEAVVTVDAGCALLRLLKVREGDAGWLLHHSVTEWLCGVGCRTLLTQAPARPFLPDGQRYFTDRLGYTVARVRATRIPASS